MPSRFASAGALCLVSFGLLTNSFHAGAEDGVAAFLPNQIALIGKGDGYWIHAAPYPSGGFDWLRAHDKVLLLHTTTDCGKMQCLLTAGTFAGMPIPMGIDRIPYTMTRLLGVTTTDKYLYAAIWQAETLVMNLQGRPQHPSFDTGAYWLSAWNVRDGKKLSAIEVVGQQLPKKPPAAALDRGPLTVEADTVALFGASFQFDGRAFAKRDAGRSQE